MFVDELTLFFLLVGVTVAIAALHLVRRVVPGLVLILNNFSTFLEWRHSGQPVVVNSQIPPLPWSGKTDLLSGAATALTQPPGLRETLAALLQRDPHDRFRIPIGWYRGSEGKPGLARASLVGDVNNIQITGQNNTGKDNLAYAMLLSLALLEQNQVSFCIIDGKGLDFAPWKHKAQTWQVALTPEDIGPTLRALSTERERRRQLLEAAGVPKWEEYIGSDLPLLVVYISELSLLIQALGSKAALERWLNAEMGAGRAFGIRYIVATHNVSTLATMWRIQVSLCIGGFLPGKNQDEPNMGMSTAEIRSAMAVPPSQLPPPPQGAGVFTAIQGRDAVTVRAPYLSTAERRYWLAHLPDRPVEPAMVDADLTEADQLLSNLLSKLERTNGIPVSVSVAAEPVGRVQERSVSPVPEADTDTDTDTDTGAEGGAALSKAGQRQREKIRKALQIGLSPTDIADIIGGNRNRAFKLIKVVQEELTQEATLVSE